MELAKTDLSIVTLLRLMETQQPEAIRVNHVIITDDDGLGPVGAESTGPLASFTVEFSGFVEIEMTLDATYRHVQTLTLRQAAMTFSELAENGDVLPNLTINCQVLEAGDRKRLDALARRYVKDGKMNDRSRGEALLTQYAAKAMFCPRKYGGMSNEQ